MSLLLSKLERNQLLKFKSQLKRFFNTPRSLESMLRTRLISRRSVGRSTLARRKSAIIAHAKCPENVGENMKSESQREKNPTLSSFLGKRLDGSTFIGLFFCVTLPLQC